jgi:hypothetical protein
LGAAKDRYWLVFFDFGRAYNHLNAPVWLLVRDRVTLVSYETRFCSLARRRGNVATKPGKKGEKLEGVIKVLGVVSTALVVLKQGTEWVKELYDFRREAREKKSAETRGDRNLPSSFEPLEASLDVRSKISVPAPAVNTRPMAAALVADDDPSLGVPKVWRVSLGPINLRTQKILYGAGLLVALFICGMAATFFLLRLSK